MILPDLDRHVHMGIHSIGVITNWETYERACLPAVFLRLVMHCVTCVKRRDSANVSPIAHFKTSSRTAL